jgi:ABC-type multidrug transport system fused ATPase/permease subunit
MSIAFGGLGTDALPHLFRGSSTRAGNGLRGRVVVRHSDGVRETAREIRFRNVSFFAYPGGLIRSGGIRSDDSAGSSLAIVGQNGAGKTTLAKLLAVCMTCSPRHRSGWRDIRESI